ncbi:MAG: hypothetical protein R3F37_00220 [Candidatus Competibacteraceae bacterium]
MREDPGFTYESPCNSNIWQDVCGSAERVDELSLRGEILTGIVIQELTFEARLPEKEANARLDRAHTAVELAVEATQPLKQLEWNATQPTPATARYADKINAQLGSAEIALRGCLNQVEQTQRKFSTANLDRAIQHCASASDAFVAARDQVRRLPSGSATDIKR